MAEIRQLLAYHVEWLGRLIEFGCPRWKLQQVSLQCDELEQAYEWCLFERENEV